MKWMQDTAKTWFTGQDEIFRYLKPDTCILYQVSGHGGYTMP